MRVLVLGAGAIGGYFGARLIEAGHEVAFLVRPARAALLAERGLTVHAARGDFARPVRALTDVDPSDAFDLAIVSCKAFDLDAAIAAIAPGIGADTGVLPLLNGIRHFDALDAAFGASRVLGGLCHISVTLDDGGAIRQFGALERLTFGACDGRPVRADIAAGLRAIGPDVVESAQVLAALWEKFAFIATLAGATCMMRASVGEIVATGEGAALIARLYAECADVAASAGYPIDADAKDAARTILTAPGSPLKASMLRDLERGARTEGEHILGDLHARAIGNDIDAPLLAAALTHVRAYESARTRAAS